VVDQAVQDRCASVGQLRRHAGYAPATTMVVPPVGSSALLAEGVSLCSFRFEAGNASRQGLAALSLAITRDGESVNLLKSVHLPNLP
jgi:hypothetical protein